jgi:hypothetical protein
MLLIDWLKAKWMVYGLDAPIFAWIAAAGLFVLTLIQLARLLWLVRKECQIHRDTIRGLDEVKIKQGASPREGLSSQAYEAIVKISEKTPEVYPIVKTI